MIFDDTRCELGEGALWHPVREALFWFDIHGHRLHGEGRTWQWHEAVSSAGWIDRDRLFVASGSGLWEMDLRHDTRRRVVALEEEDTGTRSNDGKADPWGGFWIGTMGRNGEEDRGALYRYYDGELRRLRAPMTVPNGLCFDRARGVGYVSDTPRHKVWRHRLDPATGWPIGEEELFLDLSDGPHGPDGATLDSEGRFWSAQWGSSRVACYSPEGHFLGEIPFPASLTTCPAFGGPGLDELFVTTGQEDFTDRQRDAEPHAGKTFCVPAMLNGQRVQGVPEPAVRLP
ncbi:SMP-30/gluconolactonase/LRE family protein [Falsirhodobacter algicola]|uniref:SMP-30/gluconolactonase/LRE family protein n=1 Tax=Falsirhodobacter algicola TaxID=2692330 RepID=A0A8J8SM71_9RHOB|nr:SMP-30/gluconolactonase/LRE family protein [Falsirhodobacter algicola]QUS37273.1 SMP-30/gluconolactonase/LRE family protein [Falsirhodobacter algicola]